jgi:hypothetical protein
VTVLSADGTFARMDSKPPIEQFIYNCFHERTAALKLRLEIHQIFRRRFYRSDCFYDSRRGCVERSEAEKIVNVPPSEITSVVTTGCTGYRSRYRVKSFGDGWLIREIDTECSRCHLTGVSAECPICGGTGWQSWKDRARMPKRGEQRVARTTSSTHSRSFEYIPPEEELGSRLFRDPAIEQFMMDHFRARTTLQKKEVEIHGDYAKRFYSPEYDWTRREFVQGREAERIVSVMPVSTGAHVITSGVPLWLRYHLRPVGQSWLIWEVDLECINCYAQGRSPDCFLCGGTIWEHRKPNQGFTRGGPPGQEPTSEQPRW